MKYTTRVSFGGVRQIAHPIGAIIATLAADPAGDALFEALKHGLAQTPGSSLFDEDAGEFVVGDVGQLA